MSAIRPLVVGLLVGTVAFACDPSPTGVPDASLLASQIKRMTFVSTSTSSSKTGLVPCSQPYDSVTQVIGPKGGSFVVGPHYVEFDSLALTSPVTITAVAPKDTVRWVRFQPDGLVFNTTADGWSAVLYTDYSDCDRVSDGDTLRMVQVSDSLAILGYLLNAKVKNNGVKIKADWGGSTKYAAGLLQHFSNYAIAW